MPDGTFTITNFYEEAFKIFGQKREIPDIDVRFYPYIGINHTIRVRDGGVFVRISEICRDMPPAGHQALAFILVAKLLRKKVPARAREIYSGYINTQAVREKATQSKRARGRKIITHSAGEAYDLNEIFERLNRDYFRGKIPKPSLTWSARKTYRILGHHDATHEAIAVSRSLDSADVPRYVVEYIVFHEMLHIHHPTQHRDGRRYNHTPAFRNDERKFEYFEQAESWIEKNIRKLKKNAGKK